MANIGILRCYSSLRRISPQCLKSLRFISTSGKNRETATTTVGKSETTHAECDVKKNWVSYGYDYASQTDDLNAMHSTMFITVSLCMVVGGFFWAYMPDFKMKDWAQREAYLELRRREAQGLPLIDRNFIDPAKIQLPSDEELGDTEIII